MDRLEAHRMFVAVMETGSFVGAAERLGTSSGQASKLVSRLEGELGVRLLNRTTRAVTPTEAGQAYYDRLRPLLEEFEDLDLSIRDASQAPKGRLRVTAPLTFGALELAPALNQFAALYPEIELDVAFSESVVSLIDEGFDMAVRVGQPRDSSLISRKLCEVRIVVVGAVSYLDRWGEPGTPCDLSGHECIIDTNFAEPNRWFFNTSNAERAVAIKGRIRYSNAEACLQAAEAGLGLACVPAFVAGEAIRRKRVKRLLSVYERTSYGVYALHPQSRHVAAKVRALVDFLVDRYRDAPHWEAGW